MAPKFTPSDAYILFVLGGPGSGKGTQSANLVRDYGFVHISAGDLLRAEQEREGSTHGEMIKQYIRDGAIVPMEVTVQLLSNAIGEVIEKRKEEGKTETPRFLIDGFPRKQDQADHFEGTVCVAAGVLYLECDEGTMLERLTSRGKTSGRADDNDESIKKRFRVFEEQSYPVINFYEKQGKVLKVSSRGAVEDIYNQVKEGLQTRWGIEKKASE